MRLDLVGRVGRPHRHSHGLLGEGVNDAAKQVAWVDLATVHRHLDVLGIYPPVAEYLERHLG